MQPVLPRKLDRNAVGSSRRLGCHRRDDQRAQIIVHFRRRDDQAGPRLPDLTVRSSDRSERARPRRGLPNQISRSTAHCRIRARPARHRRVAARALLASAQPARGCAATGARTTLPASRVISISSTRLRRRVQSQDRLRNEFTPEEFPIFRNCRSAFERSCYHKVITEAAGTQSIVENGGCQRRPRVSARRLPQPRPRARRRFVRGGRDRLVDSGASRRACRRAARRASGHGAPRSSSMPQRRISGIWSASTSPTARSSPLKPRRSRKSRAAE